MKKIALTVAGSDPSGGAGLQLDLKVFEYFNVFGMAVVSSLTIQNSKKVFETIPVKGEDVFRQIEALCLDFNIDAVKTGMLLTGEVIDSVVRAYEDFKLKNLVVDPVLVSSSGKELLEKKAITKLIDRLIPLSKVITPNIPETEALTGIRIRTFSDIEKAAEKIRDMGAETVVIKGGHFKIGETVTDFILTKEDSFFIEYPRVKKENIHGTGCAFSSAIASNLALGKGVVESIKISRAFLQLAIERSVKMGRGAYYLNF